MARKADISYIQENVTVQHYSIIPYYVLMHLGKWNEILQLPKPSKLLKYPTAIWHYVRGMAYAATGQLDQAKRELQNLKKIAQDESLKSQLIWDMNSAFDLVSIGSYILEGEILGFEKKYDEAQSWFTRATEIEDKLAYTEPPDWFFSTRHTAGHWLVQAGKFSEAEMMFRHDLDIFPENGWALMGLYNSLKGQNKLEEANKVKARFDKAWQYADFKISSSRKY